MLNNDNFWARATSAIWLSSAATPRPSQRPTREAIALADKDWDALDSTSANRLLQSIGFAPDRVAAGIATFERALGRLQKPAESWKPEKVFLFSGHMIDAPERKQPRFPADKEPIAAAAITKALDDLAPPQPISPSPGRLRRRHPVCRGRHRPRHEGPAPAAPARTRVHHRVGAPAANGDDWRKRFSPCATTPVPAAG